jgi:hypothetical protein
MMLLPYPDHLPKEQYLTWVEGPSVRFAMSCIAIYREMFLKMDPPKIGFGIADSLNTRGTKPGKNSDEQIRTNLYQDYPRGYDDPTGVGRQAVTFVV